MTDIEKLEAAYTLLTGITEDKILADLVEPAHKLTQAIAKHRDIEPETVKAGLGDIKEPSPSFYSGFEEDDE